MRRQPWVAGAGEFGGGADEFGDEPRLVPSGPPSNLPCPPPSRVVSLKLTGTIMSAGLSCPSTMTSFCRVSLAVAIIQAKVSLIMLSHCHWSGLGSTFWTPLSFACNSQISYCTIYVKDAFTYIHTHM